MLGKKSSRSALCKHINVVEIILPDIFADIFRVDPDLRSAAYCFGIKNGGYAEWAFAFNRYKQETVASEKLKLLYGMACTDKLWILNK